MQDQSERTMEHTNINYEPPHGTMYMYQGSKKLRIYTSDSNTLKITLNTLGSTQNTLRDTLTMFLDHFGTIRGHIRIFEKLTH